MNATDEIIVRNWQPTDAAELSGYLNNMNILKELPDSLPHPFTKSHARVFIGMSNCSCSKLDRAIEYKGKLVGGISIIPQENLWSHNAEIRFFTGEPHWNKGFMQSALPISIREAFDSFNFQRIYALVFEHNRRAIHVLKKNGFEQEGVLRSAVFRDNSFHDVCLLSILNQEKNL